MWDELVKLIKENPDQINALAAVCALLISFLSILLTFIALSLQRQHNFKSVTPIASILIGDFEDNLHVTLKNTGIGPAIIEQFRVFYEKEEKDNIISWMPISPMGINWANFTPNIDGRSITPNESLIVLQLIGNPSDEEFAAFRDDVRRALKGLTVSLLYKDIYDRRMPIEQRDLKWFARNLAEEDLVIIKDI
ncbi:MAG TPA: hypothetical protein VGB05_04165 [Pyrinomonadaceae bacterium]|jgi:hypothetical protein